MKHYCWIRFALVVALTELIFLPRISSGNEAYDAIVNPANYALVMGSKVENIQDLETYFDAQQEHYQKINPPDPDFVLHQPGFPTLVPCNL